MGRKKANVLRYRRDCAICIQCSIRQYLARKRRRDRNIEVRHLGAVYYMQLLPKIIFTRNLVIVNPAVRRIQGMYRAWKRREPVRHFNASRIIQMSRRRFAARKELERRFKGLDRKNANRFGHFDDVTLVITAMVAQTEHIYDPYAEGNHMDLDLWMIRLGLKKHLAQVRRRGVDTLRKLYTLTGIIFEEDEDWRETGANKFEDLKKQKRAMMKKINLAKKKVESLKDMEPEIPEKSAKLSRAERRRQIKRAKARVTAIKKRAADDLEYEKKGLID